ncbi:autotransporter domain-containing protein [Fusobacterium ulcerans]
MVFSKDGSTFDPNAEDNPYPDNSWEEATKTYTNNAVISGKGDNASGLKIESETNSEKFNLINDGSITGSASSYEGYGISNSGSITELLNNGSITGSATYSGSGYGIYIYSGGSITELLNNGSITGSATYSGYGIYIYSGGSITELKNNGLITGSTGGFSYGINNRGSIEKLKNNGLITGSSPGTNSGIHNSKSIEKLKNNGLITGSGFNGYGISNNETIGALTNTGVIYGTTNAIYNYESAKINGANNYGILASSGSMVNNNLTIVDKSSPSTLATNTTEKENKIFNYGLAFTVASVGSYKATDEAFKTFGTTQENEEVIVGYEKDDAGNLTTPIKHEYTIINAKDTGTGKNSITGTESITIKNGSLSYDYKNNTSGPLKTHQAKSVILNGITDTLLVSGNSDDNILNNSVVNAYGTAVKFNDAGGNLTLSGTVVNGGIDGKAAVSGSGNGDTLILQSGDITYVVGTPGTQSTETQNTIVNGNINMGEGDDILTIEAGSIVNGTMDGGTDTGRADDDTINFGTASNTRAASGIDDNINILHNISNFENMNINTNVTLFEKTVDSDGNPTDLKVSGAENITIGANGVLTLRIAKNDTGDNTHALYGNNGIISSNGGKLLLALNGAGNGEIISFGTTELDDNTLVSGKDGTLDTTSKFHTVEKIDEKNVKIIVKVNIPEILKYKQLNKIYCSIVSVNDLIGNFNVDSDENLTLFLGYLNNIYAGNPYSYSSELSRKSAGMFRDIVTENQFKADTGKWMIYGGLTHVDGGTKDTYYGKGYYTYDIGSSDMDADTKITGAYMLGEYGVSDTLTSGVVIGGNKLKSDLSNGSKVDGDALYLGAYAKKYIGNLKVTAGAGFQYGDYDADRLAVNKVASSTGTPVVKYSDNYRDTTCDIYINGRYSHSVEENLFLEPYGTLSYIYIKQDGTDEGSKALGIETDSKSFNYTTAKVGVDLKKVIPHKKGKSTLSAGVSYTRILNGAEKEHITGRFKGGSDFDILVARKNEQSIGLNAKYALELENGILFDVKGTYAVERDSHNGAEKNKTKGEWIVGIGLGYKF